MIYSSANELKVSRDTYDKILRIQEEILNQMIIDIKENQTFSHQNTLKITLLLSENSKISLLHLIKVLKKTRRIDRVQGRTP